MRSGLAIRPLFGHRSPGQPVCALIATWPAPTDQRQGTMASRQQGSGPGQTAPDSSQSRRSHRCCLSRPEAGKSLACLVKVGEEPNWTPCSEWMMVPGSVRCLSWASIAHTERVRHHAVVGDASQLGQASGTGQRNGRDHPGRRREVWIIEDRGKVAHTRCPS